MTSIKHLLWQESPKPKRNFIKENAKKFKDPKKPSQCTQMDGQHNRQQTVSALSSNRMTKSVPNQQYSASSKAQVTAVPRALTHRRPLRAFPIKKLTTQLEPNINQLSLSHDRDKPPINLSKPKDPPKAFRNQACQTVQGKELDHISHESVIRYPSSRQRGFEENKLLVREMGLQTDDSIPNKGAGDLIEVNKIGPKDTIDFVKLNMTTPLKPKQTNTKDDPNRAPSSYQKGILPKYLREQKKDKENEKDARGDVLENGITAQMLLPDDMRKKLLTKLKKDHKELVDQLNLLPFSTSSLKTLQRKQQIEKELDILEKRISNFSREKVFIRDVTAA